jgi:hypothetical protein
MVKYYNFEIVNIHYLENDISEIIDKIKKSNNVVGIYRLFDLKKKTQCISMEHISKYIGGSRMVY